MKRVVIVIIALIVLSACGWLLWASFPVPMKSAIVEAKAANFPTSGRSPAFGQGASNPTGELTSTATPPSVPSSAFQNKPVANETRSPTPPEKRPTPDRPEPPKSDKTKDKVLDLEAPVESLGTLSSDTRAAENQIPIEHTEATKLTARRVFTFKMPGAKPEDIQVTIPVLYPSGTIYLSEDRLTELYEIEQQIRRIKQASDELRIAASVLIDRYNALIRLSIPPDVLSPDSPTVPNADLGPLNASNVVDIPQTAIKIYSEK